MVLQIIIDFLFSFYELERTAQIYYFNTFWKKDSSER